MSSLYYDTPEGFLAVPADAEPGYHYDALTAALERAKAVLSMVRSQFDGTNGEAGRFTDAVITGAIWSVEGDLALLETLLKHGWDTVKEGGR